MNLFSQPGSNLSPNSEEEVNTALWKNPPRELLYSQTLVCKARMNVLTKIEPLSENLLNIEAPKPSCLKIKMLTSAH